MLILLQPGIQPLGQFDIEDDDVDLVVGGEVVIFNDLDVTDGYAADVSNPGPQVQVLLGSAGFYKVGLEKQGLIWGFADDGSSTGLNGRGYGTMFGQIIGAVVGQGTGIGNFSNKGTVTVGPSTIRGSGKITVWDKPGLYGMTRDAFVPGDGMGYFDGAEIAKTPNISLYGFPNIIQAGPSEPDEWRGKLTSQYLGGAPNEYGKIGYSLGTVNDTSFVSTPEYYAGAISKEEYWAVYQVRRK